MLTDKQEGFIYIALGILHVFIIKIYSDIFIDMYSYSSPDPSYRLGFMGILLFVSIAFSLFIILYGIILIHKDKEVKEHDNRIQ